MVKKKRSKVRARTAVRRIKKSIRKAAPKRSARAKTKRIVRKAKVQVKQLKKEVEKEIKKAAVSLTERQIGYVSHFFTNIGVGIIELTDGSLKVGDRIRIKGETTDLMQTIDSMQYDHQPTESAGKGKSVGIKMNDRVREHDKVFLI